MPSGSVEPEPSNEHGQRRCSRDVNAAVGAAFAGATVDRRASTVSVAPSLSVTVSVTS